MILLREQEDRMPELEEQAPAEVEQDEPEAEPLDLEAVTSDPLKDDGWIFFPCPPH